MICSGSTGISATAPLLSRIGSRVEVLAPECALRQTEQRATAARTDLLIVPPGLELVAESEVVLDRGEIAHHLRRRMRLPASAAARALPARARVLVETDAE